MAQASHRASDAAGASGKARILLVEDETTIREAVCQLLKAEGYEVLTASDGSEALTTAQEASPQLIILDLGLPSAEPGAGQFDGFGVMQWLSVRLPKFIPVIVFTARQDESTRRQAQAMGAAAFLAKPFDPKELMSAVQKILAAPKQ